METSQESQTTDPACNNTIKQINSQFQKNVPRHIRKITKRNRFDLAGKLKTKDSNPIGALQAICTHNRWPTPIYRTIEESGVPHKREYALSVSVNYYNTYGLGYSKKTAKKDAALKMCNLLISINFEINTSPRHIHHDFRDVDHYFKNTSGVFFEQLRNYDFNDPKSNFVDFLTNLQNEQLFTMFSLKSEDFSIHLREIVVFLCIADRHMFLGRAEDYLKAKHLAFRSALHFLHMIQIFYDICNKEQECKK